MQQEWNIGTILTWTTGYFHDRGIPAARLDAEVLLAHVLGVDRVYIYTHYDRPLDQTERERYRNLIKRRVGHEPVAYITGSREFMSLAFEVNSQVLIPRPETELLVETVLGLSQPPAHPTRICDVGTGCGAVAVSLAYYMPQAVITATDLSEAALVTARGNAGKHGVHVEFYHGDLLEPIPSEYCFHFIVANLPYISPQEYQSLPPDVLCFEPKSALLASGDGLDLYRRLLPQAMSRLLTGGFLLMEIGLAQGDAAIKMAADYGEAQLIVDLAGRDRLIQVKKGSGS